MAGCSRCGRQCSGRLCRDCERDAYWDDAALDDGPESYVVDCRECGQQWGPYSGTKWRTPKEHAAQAVGGIVRTHPHETLEVAPDA